MTLVAIDAMRTAWPLHGTASSRAIEHCVSAALPPHTLMQRAGLAVSRLALAIAPHAPRIWIVAGPGNNGGDGLEAALHLIQAGKQVTVCLHADTARMPADAALSLQRAQAAGVPIAGAGIVQAEAGDLVIDALLGLGARASAGTALGSCIDALNRLPAPVLAVDLPSGLDADSGQPIGGPVCNAMHTLSLLTLKPGLYTGSGRDHAGRVWFDDLGADAAATAPDAWLAGGAAMREPLPARRHAMHKGSFGDVFVVGGAGGMLGAPLLAARAAHAAGAGRVHVDLLENALAHDAARLELMFRPGWWKSAPKALAAATVLAGCGGGSAIGAALPALLAHTTRLVLDADALNAIAGDPMLERQLRARAGRDRVTVLTPHPLEAARLLGVSTAEVQADRLRAARLLAERYRSGVVLKGSGSVLCGPGQPARINPTGDARLASAGTGDVLAGWIAGLWAQVEDTSLEAALHVAAASVFRHGLAAERATGRLLRAGDLIEAMVGL